MESWVALFQIFLNSPCPETEASLWLQQSFNQPPGSSTPISTTSFLSLLTRSTDIALTDSCSPSSSSLLPSRRVMWIQTLPDAIQARILAFLVYDSQRFCGRELCQLAETMLREGRELDFWVKRTAHRLLDVVSRSSHERLSCLNLNSEEEEQVDDEFSSLPDWLKDEVNDVDVMLPWLPLSQKQLNMATRFSNCGEKDDATSEEGEREIVDEVIEEVDEVVIKEVDEYLNTQVEEKAKRLKGQLLSLQTTAKAVELAAEIQQLCKGGGDQSLAILGIIEPWRADDETAAVLVSNLHAGDEDELGWPSHVLCSVILPKLLVLKEPASRVLLTATVGYCKVHQRAAEYALLLPLMLRTEGINNAICDVITKVVRESLHPGHVSALCQKLLSNEDDLKKFICLPVHQCLIGSKLEWTESLFSLMQNILNHNIHLTQDSVDRLVQHACGSADRFSKSLKFGNFLLCFVAKCSPMLKFHKSLLTEATQHTCTLVTKSVLSKLSSL